MRTKRKPKPNYAHYIPKTVKPLNKVSWSFLVGADYSTPTMVLAKAELQHPQRQTEENTLPEYSHHQELMNDEAIEESTVGSRHYKKKKKKGIQQTLADLSYLDEFTPNDSDDELPPRLDQDEDLQFNPPKGEDPNPDLVSTPSVTSRPKRRKLKKMANNLHTKPATRMLLKKRRKPNEFYPTMKPLRSKHRDMDDPNQMEYYRTIEQLSHLDESMLQHHLDNQSVDVKPALESMKMKKKMIFSQNYKSFKPTGKSLTPYRHYTNYKAALEYADHYQAQQHQQQMRKQRQHFLNQMVPLSNEEPESPPPMNSFLGRAAFERQQFELARSPEDEDPAVAAADIA